MVLDAITQKPVEKVTIRATETSGAFPSDTQTSNHQGKATLKLQTNSRYQVELAHPDYLVHHAPELVLEQTTQGVVYFMQPITRGQIIRFEDLKFSPGTTDLLAKGEAGFEGLLAFLKENDGLIVELGVHCNSQIEDDDISTRLTQERADALKARLVENGIAPERLAAKGFGELFLLNQCNDGVKCSTVEHDINERVELLIIKNQE